MSGFPTREYVVPVPAGWHVAHLEGDLAVEADRIVSECMGHLDRDSSAIPRRKMHAALMRTFSAAAPEDGDGRLSTLIFPLPRRSEEMIPASVAVVEITPETHGLRPLEVLVGLSLNDSTSKPIDAAGSVALRTLTFRDLRERFLEVVDAEHLTDAEDADIRAETPDHMYSLRATYVLGREDPERWLMIAGSALVPVNDSEDEVSAAYLSLFDAVVGGVRWVEAA